MQTGSGGKKKKKRKPTLQLLFNSDRIKDENKLFKKKENICIHTYGYSFIFFFCGKRWGGSAKKCLVHTFISIHAAVKTGLKSSSFSNLMKHVFALTIQF